MTLQAQRPGGGLIPLKLWFVVVVTCFILSTAYISLLVLERQTALKEVSRYNAAWIASQAVSEVTRLEQRISAFGLPGSGIDKDEVQLRFEIVLNRLRLLREGEFQEFILGDPDRRAAVTQLTEAVRAAEPLIRYVNQLEVRAQLLGLFAPLQPALTSLASAANRFGAERVAQDQQYLIQLHWIFSVIAGSLVLCGIGLVVLLSWHNYLLEAAHRDLRAVSADLQNASERLEDRNKMLEASEIELRAQNERFDAALNNMSHGLCMVDPDERIIVCNQRFVQMFGIETANLQSRTVGEVMRSVRAEAGPARALHEILARQMLLASKGGASSFIEGHLNNELFSVSQQPMSNGGWVATYDDVTEKQRAEAQIAFLAHHDPLTHLANRELFRDEMDRAITCAQREGTSVAVLFLDLDRFKDVNDTLGHQTGDSLLKEVAARLLGCVRETDIVARLGGDEFGIVQVGAEQPSDVSGLAARLVDKIGSPYHIAGQEIIIGASVGVAMGPDGSSDPDELLQFADLALYRAKTEGRATYRVFEPEMAFQFQDRLALERDLRKALECGEFELHYQPQIEVATKRIIAYEALIRWHHPGRGLVMPMEFIPVAEETGLISRLGDWVIQQACHQAAGWPNHVKVAVNVSPAQFRSKNLVSVITEALESSRLSPNRLEIEITESALLENDEDTVMSLHQLRGLGVEIAMDDFGTGFSSLSYLQSFPFHKIKIDQSFIKELSSRSNSLAIVRSIIDLGKSLGMVTCAEGVDSEEQFMALRAAGCTEAQGYFFGRPGPVSEVLIALEKLSSTAEAA